MGYQRRRFVQLKGLQIRTIVWKGTTIIKTKFMTGAACITALGLLDLLLIYCARPVYHMLGYEKDLAKRYGMEDIIIALDHHTAAGNPGKWVQWCEAIGTMEQKPGPFCVDPTKAWSYLC